VIGGRYEVDSRLGKGGMGEVFRVRDRSSGQELALKRIVGTGEREASLFEREFHTLRSLAHPRIIRVHDYGVDGDSAYYTMELLDGQDLRDAAPLPYRTACRYLRDVASSLALLHARRLLHRDLSPRNVRITADDRCKLIDFGALTGFGTTSLVVGTPPMIAPEVLAGVPLDQRVDLYALGALVYFVLTGRHAFAARRVRELHALWEQTPLPPSSLAPDDCPVPEALDELVMSLLSRNPMARPASAAEVIEHLGRIGELPDEPQDLGARSYLQGGRAVGRARPWRRLRRRIELSRGRRGGVVTLESSQGMGGSRMLADLGIEAQLSGFWTIGVDAREHREEHGVAREIVERVLRLAPDSVELIDPADAPLLARFSDVLADALDVAADAAEPEAPGELRLPTEEAIRRWLLSVADRRAPLLITVDDAQRLDLASASLLLALCLECRFARMMIVLARDPDETTSAPELLQAITAKGSRLSLHALDADEVRELVRGVFGEVPNVERLADWLHRASAGRPAAVMELINLLVDDDVLRFESGTWSLPQELPEARLPSGLDQVLERRLERLSEPARELARAMSVHRGPVSLDLCLTLSRSAGMPAPHEALDELIAAEVMLAHDGGHDFTHDRMRERLQQSLSPQRRALLHRTLGEALLREQDGELEAGWHLLHGGEELAGARLLARAATEMQFESDSMAGAVPALKAALQVYRKHGVRDHDVIELLGPLAMAGYYVDRHLADLHGQDAVETYERLIGIRLARRLRGLLGRHLALYLGLGSALLRHLLTRGMGGLAGLRNRITEYITCVAALTGVATICLDGEKARGWAARLELLSALGRQHAAGIAHRFSETLALLTTDYTALTIERLRRLLRRFEDRRPIADMPDASRRLIHGGVLYALGACEGFRDTGKALECADKLERVGLSLYQMAADQVRTNCYASRGEVDQADHYRRRVEDHAMRAGTAWQVEVWAPASLLSAYALTENVVGTRRAVEDLSRLAKELPSLVFYRDLGRGIYSELRGDDEEALRAMRQAGQRSGAREIIGWAQLTGTWVGALRRLGRPEEALRRAEAELDRLRPEDLQVATMHVRTLCEHALCLSELGRVDEAAKRLDALLVEHIPRREPVVLGRLHHARSLVALETDELRLARHHATEMERWLRPTQNPTLIAKCEGLKRALASHAGQTESALFPRVRSLAPPSVGLETVRSALSEARADENLPAVALRVLLELTDCERGFLFRHDDGVLELEAPRQAQPPPATAVQALLDEIAAVIADADATAVVSHHESLPATAQARSLTHDGVAYLCVPLVATTGSERVCYGGALLETADCPARMPESAALRQLAANLIDRGLGPS
jgi:hypothetical protein